MKTVKSLDLWRRMLPDPRAPITVSTLREADGFAAAGARDILYAVGIVPAKLPRVAALRETGVDITVILDSVEAAQAVAAARAPALIEVDVDDARAGIAVKDGAQLLAVGQALGASLRGILTHSGGSYATPGAAALTAMAEQERAGAVRAAEILRASGLPCRVISVVSTPAAHFARDLSGVTEVRAGVYMFMDLVMERLGVCSLDDIAIRVAASVIGRREDKGWLLLDAGWMALSRDRGAEDQGHGLVCDLEGRPYSDLIVVSLNQEHGIAALRPGATGRLPDLRVGDTVTILPIHACATAAQFDAYEIAGASEAWPRFRGW